MCKIINQDCDLSLANDRSLPVNSYVVSYMKDGFTHYDIVLCNKRVEIFDMYWDQYRENLLNIVQTEGRVNPRVWQDPNQKKKTK